MRFHKPDLHLRMTAQIAVGGGTPLPPAPSQPPTANNPGIVTDDLRGLEDEDGRVIEAN